MIITTKARKASRTNQLYDCKCSSLKSEQHSQHLMKISGCFFRLCKMFCGRSRYLEHSDGAGLQQFSQGFKDEESSEIKY